MSKFAFTTKQQKIQSRDRELLQDCIKRMFPELVNKNTKELCGECTMNASRRGVICSKYLIPVTSDGQPCPYFNQRDEI